MLRADSLWLHLAPAGTDCRTSTYRRTGVSSISDQVTVQLTQSVDAGVLSGDGEGLTPRPTELRIVPLAVRLIWLSTVPERPSFTSDLRQPALIRKPAGV